MNPNLLLALLGALVAAGAIKIASARTWRKLRVGEFPTGTADRKDPPPPPRSRASNNSFAETEVRNLMAHNRIRDAHEDAYVWTRICSRIADIDRALTGDPVLIPESGDAEDLARLLGQLERKVGLGPLPQMTESDSK